ncbi:hypothetical protein LL240_09810 [Oceanimonas baumannii]|uniref:hypothetical protein n=1 Tax=Oceanimonas baumannii TaxID=129578 RepID=UPI001D1872B5|nr:hypothetical protein [Oceanimonas baumannii]MCC4264750.1 hypothetical protein [Oceanimonas baumannii]
MTSFESRYKTAEKQLQEQLSASEFWHLVAPGQTTATNPEILGVLQSSTGLFYTTEQLNQFMEAHPFIGIWHENKKQDLVLESASKLLWSNSEAKEKITLNDANSILKRIDHLGLKGWTLPRFNQLQQFSIRHQNPYRKGGDYFLSGSGNTAAYRPWLCTQGRVDTEAGNWSINENAPAFIFSINLKFYEFNYEEIAAELLDKNWKFTSFDDKNALIPSQINSENLLFTIGQLGFDFIPAKGSGNLTPIKIAELPSLDELPELDYRTCRLPKMEASRLNDPERGLWELWGCEKEFLNQHNLVARDPKLDVLNRTVAIDFGTSSTVVATENQHGESELLRIGVRDFYQELEPHHYENPTVLEFLDFEQFTNIWTRNAYRPELNWDWVRASHEAQASFRDNPGDTDILASILPRLKQWALRDEMHQRVRLTGRKGKEIELVPHAERNPVRGQALEVSETDPLDPVELYAWYLGMAINWRERGIFLKYYLSFPVKYPLEVKNRILASFRRGLQRSFPQTLIDHHPQVLQQFEVQDLASEPAAYAAAALPFLELEPTDEGVPYAVFDFGGGTSDFDFGIWRWANDEEDAKGYESVFEHYASSGDNFLGGENLLEHLVYASFQNNLPVLRANKVQFVKPMDATSFPGSEPFLAPTQAAQTNAVMLAAKLRPFLESDQASLDSQIKLDLINSSDEKVTCELALDAQMLDELLQQRIHRGLLSFLHELKKVLPQFPTAAPIQLLLAGNGSRSRHISALFENEEEIWKSLCKKVFEEHVPEIQIHKPLPVDMTTPYAPTSKTGVALGLLQVVPGKNILLTNHLHQAHDGQAPFAWHVGRLRRNQLVPALTPDSGYQQWQELGPIQQGVFYLYHSNSPRTALGLKKGDPELKAQRLDLHEASEGAKLYARAIAPNQIEFTSATEVPALRDVVSETLILE